MDFYHHHDDGTQHLCQHISSGEGERLEIEVETYECSSCGTKIMGRRRGDLFEMTLKGYDLEDEVLHHFKRRGWRSFRIYGAFDIIALRNGSVLLIQCKRRRKKLTPLVRRDILDEWQYIGVGTPHFAYLDGQDRTENIKLMDLLTEKETVLHQIAALGAACRDNSASGNLA